VSVLRDESAPPAAADGRITVDHLANRHDPVEVVPFDVLDVGCDGDAIREPHRHDYHELIWTRAGVGQHMLDHRTVPVVPGTITVIGRGQVHVFERASGLYGALVRFGEELLHGDSATGANPAWLVGNRSVQTVDVPPGEAGRLEAVIELLAAETRRPLDSHSVALQRHFVSALLLCCERWYEVGRTERGYADDSDLQLYRRFTEVLERDYVRHHDAPHFAEALGVPQAALSRALVNVAGRATKELITDRRMLEAARLLRFTEMSIGEVAYRAGYGDQLYFSRAFKRQFGEAPSAYRERMRGRAPER
jgi:AraC family transcriptional activator of pobA